jgi:hypothetical protein
MRFIPTRLHGLLDYLVGLALIGAPWIFGFAPDNVDSWGAETITPIVIGALLIVQSFFTNYEWGISKRLSMPSHLMLDMLMGVVLAASPWAFNFAGYVYGPHLTVGLALIVVALVSQRGPVRSTPGFTNPLHV